METPPFSERHWSRRSFLLFLLSTPDKPDQKYTSHRRAGEGKNIPGLTNQFPCIFPAVILKFGSSHGSFVPLRFCPARLRQASARSHAINAAAHPFFTDELECPWRCKDCGRFTRSCSCSRGLTEYVRRQGERSSHRWVSPRC